MICKKCGTEIFGGARFCPKCGNILENISAEDVYKSTRKAAGKSSAPKAIAIIALLIVVGIGGGIGWWIFSNQGQPFPSEAGVQLAESANSSEPSHSPAEQSDMITSSTSANMPESNVDTQSEESSTSDNAAFDSNAPSSSAANFSDSDSGSSQAAQGDIQSYVGLWEGSMRDTESGSGSRDCYGAENYPLKLKVKEISPTGKLIADVEMLHHGHNFITQNATSSEGDEYIKIENLVGTLEQDGSFVLEESNEAHDVRIQFKTEDNRDGSRTLLANARSNGIAFNYFEDTYSLSKQA